MSVFHRVIVDYDDDESGTLTETVLIHSESLHIKFIAAVSRPNTLTACRHHFALKEKTLSLEKVVDCVFDCSAQLLVLERIVSLKYDRNKLHIELFNEINFKHLCIASDVKGSTEIKSFYLSETRAAKPAFVGPYNYAVMRIICSKGFRRIH
jgi:hypothetical protein